jgi:hypothetical protein
MLKGQEDRRLVIRLVIHLAIPVQDLSWRRLE